MISPESESYVDLIDADDLYERAKTLALTSGVALPGHEVFVLRLGALRAVYVAPDERLTVTMELDGLSQLAYLCEKKNQGNAYINERFIGPALEIVRRYMVLDDLSSV